MFITQSFNFISSKITAISIDRSLFSSGLTSLNNGLHYTLDLSLKPFRNIEPKPLLAAVLTEIRKSSKLKDKIIEYLDLKDWTFRINLFLLLGELGLKAKIDAYIDLIGILMRDKEILGLLGNKTFINRVFRDCVNEDIEVSKLALELIKWMAQDYIIADYLISSNLVFLIGKAALKHSGNENLVSKVIEILNNHSPDIWKSSKVDIQIKRLIEMGKDLKIPSIKRMIEKIKRT